MPGLKLLDTQASQKSDITELALRDTEVEPEADMQHLKASTQGTTHSSGHDWGYPRTSHRLWKQDKDLSAEDLTTTFTPGLTKFFSRPKTLKSKIGNSSKARRHASEKEAEDHRMQASLNVLILRRRQLEKEIRNLEVRLEIQSGYD